MINRRMFLTNTLLASASVIYQYENIPSANQNKPIVVSYELTPNKHYNIGTGMGDTWRSIESYYSDSLNITLSNGNKVESWIDSKNQMNLAWPDSNRFEDLDVDSDIAESFAVDYFNKNSLKTKI